MMPGEFSGTLTLQGCVVKLSRPGQSRTVKRGACQVGGSRKSLRRLSLLLGAVDWLSYRRHVLFLTLTLPDSVHRAECLGPALDRFRKWMLRAYPEAGAVVRIEQGGRTGRLHAHALVFGACFIPAAVLRQKWRECLRCPETPRVGVEAVRDGARLALYLRKYVAKLTTTERPATTRDASGPPVHTGDTGGASASLILSTGHIWQKAGQGIPSSWYTTEGKEQQDNTLASGSYVPEEPDTTITTPAHVWQGRVWQVWGRERIKYAKADFFVLGAQSAAKVARILRRLWTGYGGSGALFVQPRTVEQLRAYVSPDASGHLYLLGARCHLF